MQKERVVGFSLIHMWKGQRPTPHKGAGSVLVFPGVTFYYFIENEAQG